MSTQTVEAAPQPPAQKQRIQGGLLDPKILLKALPDAVRKLDPRTLWRNPVMFIVEIGAVWTTYLAITKSSWFAWMIVFWLWLTVIFANLAVAVTRDGLARRHDHVVAPADRRRPRGGGPVGGPPPGARLGLAGRAPPGDPEARRD